MPEEIILEPNYTALFNRFKADAMIHMSMVVMSELS